MKTVFLSKCWAYVNVLTNGSGTHGAPFVDCPPIRVDSLYFCQLLGGMVSGVRGWIERAEKYIPYILTKKIYIYTI